jgi:rfaE bifunctional protein kinase chain/domain/rfaE bifunctional protein nucleotidyltransferase chain/domain
MAIMKQESTNTRDKIQPLEHLAEIIKPMRSNGETLVHCHGVFDLLHIGHIRHFENARKMGDILVVTVTADEHVNKGPGRPAFHEDLRVEAIAALDCVDHVAINRQALAVEPIKLLKPDFYVKGTDYQDPDLDRTGGIALEEAAVKSVGGQVAFTDDITFSSSNLINRNLELLPREVSEYLTGLSNRHSSSDILHYLDDSRSLKVLLVGETIIDEYVYCETMGKSGKEPVLAARQIESERFAGGVIAVANHVSALSDNVKIVTFLGQQDSQEDFVRAKLDPKVKTVFLPMEGDSPTIVKRRFVEIYPFQKLFEIYEMGDAESKPTENQALLETLDRILPDFDVVIVTDYGHGMVGPEVVELLCEKAPFLSVNTQVNAGNRGFNTISKYSRSDFICVSETELRMEARSRSRDLKELVLDLSSKLSCDRVVITHGKLGSLCYSKGEGFFNVPAITVDVVDRVGAGDTVFAVASLCAALGAPIEIAGFIGNVAGGYAVGVVGNRTSINGASMIRHIDTLLK